MSDINKISPVIVLPKLGEAECKLKIKLVRF